MNSPLELLKYGLGARLGAITFTVADGRLTLRYRRRPNQSSILFLMDALNQFLSTDHRIIPPKSLQDDPRNIAFALTDGTTVTCVVVTTEVGRELHIDLKE